MDIKLFLYLALILFSTKILGVLLKRIGLPEVVGALLAGLLLGPMVLGVVKTSDTLVALGEIGVILIMFTAGMETDLKQLKSNGISSTIVTLLGVVVPLGVGFVLACLFNGGFNVSHEQILTNIFYGTILTATSVSITVAALREMGKLNSKAGTVIISAAILDDIIGLIVLTFVISLRDTSVSIGIVALKTVLFFIFAIGVGIGVHYLFKYLEKKYPHNRRMSILSLVICFLFSFIAKEWFGIAEITGAFIAGAVISNIKSSKYIASRVDITAYMLFAPIFFAGIGINNSFGGFDPSMLWFGLAYIGVGLITKVAGCGLGAKLCGFNLRESTFIGIGMMSRAEVMLITVTIGIDNNFIPTSFVPYSLGLVILSSLLTPILLKLLYRKQCVIPQLPRADGTTTTNCPNV